MKSFLLLSEILWWFLAGNISRALFLFDVYKKTQITKYQPTLKNGDKIKITWFPPAKNAPYEENAYIGMEGYVEDFNSNDGAFTLTNQNYILIVTRVYLFDFI